MTSSQMQKFGKKKFVEIYVSLKSYDYLLNEKIF